MDFSFSDREFDPTWLSFKKGSRDAFESIYREHVKSLLNYGYKITSNRSVVEDSIQDLFFELWESRERVAKTTAVKFYLFKALRNKVARNLKAFEFDNLQDVIDLQSEQWSISHESNLIGFEVQSQQLENLKALLEKLPKRQQEAINLRYFHNFSNEDVAQIMNVNYQSACNLIYSALRKLKLNLKVSITSFLFFLLFF